MAETTNEYCQKGDILGIEYIVKNHNWEDEEGKKHFTYNFIANRVEFISKASKSTSKVEMPQKQAENSLNKDVFEEFGDSVSIDDNFLE